MAHNDPYAGIEFDDITESTGLAADEIKCLKVSLPQLGGGGGRTIIFLFLDLLRSLRHKEG